MSYRKMIFFAVCGLQLLANTQSANARAVRVDSGDWDLSGFTLADSTQSIGFDFDYFGFSASSAQISADGRIVLLGGGDTADLFVFFEPDQVSDGNIAQYQFGITNANFNTPGIDAGFRVTWQIIDSGGALLNEYQLTLWQLSVNAFAIEFNYNRILLGNDGSQIGIASSLGHSFDLVASLGFGFSQYSGIGDDAFSSNCAGTPSAFACNNYYFNAESFGSDASVLPEIAGGFFRQIDSKGGAVQGRYLFVSDRDNDLLSDADESIAGTDPFDPDSDDDGIGDALDVALGNPANFCSGSVAYIFSETVVEDLTCAATTSITVVPSAEVLADRKLQLIAPIVIFDPESGLIRVIGAMTVIPEAPCPGCP